MLIFVLVSFINWTKCIFTRCNILSILSILSIVVIYSIHIISSFILSICLSIWFIFLFNTFFSSFFCPIRVFCCRVSPFKVYFHTRRSCQGLVLIFDFWAPLFKLFENKKKYLFNLLAFNFLKFLLGNFQTSWNSCFSFFLQSGTIFLSIESKTETQCFFIIIFKNYYKMWITLLSRTFNFMHISC